MKPSFDIRSATVADIPQIQQLVLPFVQAKQILPRDDDELATLVVHGFIAESAECIVGFAAIEIYSKKLAEVQSLAVAASHRGQGIGKQLVRHCVQRAVEKGVLELMAITASEQLFREVGFDYSLPNQKRALFVETNAVRPQSKD